MNIGPYITLGIIVAIALVVLVVLIPLLTRLSFIMEAISLMLEGLGEYTEHPRLVWLGCLVLVLTCLGCAVVAVVVAGSLLTCNTSSPAYLCRLIGR